MKKLFIDLLKQYDLLIPFIVNLSMIDDKDVYNFLSRKIGKRKKKTLGEFMHHTHHAEWMSRAFSWHRTSEGHDTWHKIGDKWRNIVIQHDADLERSRL